MDSANWLASSRFIVGTSKPSGHASAACRQIDLKPIAKFPDWNADHPPSIAGSAAA
jgi:hypothetical protein